MTKEQPADNHLDRAAADAARREEIAAENPEPSLGRRFGQIGILGWMIVGPVLAALFLGTWLDRLIGSGITITAAMTMAGAALGLWLAFRWMHDQ